MTIEIEHARSTVGAPTASDLLGLPEDRRNVILEEAAIFAEGLYRSDPGLTDFEAFEAEGPHGDVASAPKG